MRGKRTPKRSCLQALRLLVVEDHADMRTGLSVLFRLLGCQARFAVDLATARLAISEEAFDVLLSDIHLPDGEGWDFLRELQGSHHRPRTAIAMSGFGSDRDIEESRSVGFDFHLVKPFATEELKGILDGAAAALRGAGERLLPATAPKRKMASAAAR